LEAGWKLIGERMLALAVTHRSNPQGKILQIPPTRLAIASDL
jgi:hypothetical protein